MLGTVYSEYRRDRLNSPVTRTGARNEHRVHCEVRSLKILIVDDDQSISRVLRLALSGAGHGVRVACSGEEGLLEIEQWTPDLILTDINMASLSGAAFCSTLRKRSNASIIVLSAEASSAAMAEALDAGADDYVAKPFSIPELEARIRSFARRSL